MAGQAARTLVMYHYPCFDGIWAAWAARQSFVQSGLGNVLFVPNRVFKPCTVEELELQGDEHVYLLDFIGPPGFCKQLASAAGRVVVVDHHKTASGALQGATILPDNLEVNIDMGHSGAQLALQYFKPQVTMEQEQMIAWVQDADLWTWKLPDSKAFHAGFGALELELNAQSNPQIFDVMSQLNGKAVVAQEQDRLVREAADQAFVVQLGGGDGVNREWGRCLAVRADNIAHLRSQLGNELALRSHAQGLAPIGLVAYVEVAMKDPSRIKCSLRSVSLENIPADQTDTTRVSEAFQGGGHHNASSFIAQNAEFERWRL